jgi:hypothetical protein
VTASASTWTHANEARLDALLRYIEGRLYDLASPFGWGETQTGPADEQPPPRPRTAAELIAWFLRDAAARAALAALQAPIAWAIPRVDAMRTVHHRPPHMGRQTRKRQPGPPGWARRRR